MSHRSDGQSDRNASIVLCCDPSVNLLNASIRRRVTAGSDGSIFSLLIFLRFCAFFVYIMKLRYFVAELLVGTLRVYIPLLKPYSNKLAKSSRN